MWCVVVRCLGQIIISVGDSAGNIHTLKLSPNLRKQTREIKIALAGKDLRKAGKLEVKKLADILAQVRDQRCRAEEKYEKQTVFD